VGRARELLYGLGFTHLAVSHRTEDGVEFVELDLIDLQLVQKVARKSVELFGGFHQPVEDGIGIDFEDPRRASDAQPFGQAGDDVHDELGRGAFAMENRAVGLIEVPLARHTLQLPPGLAARMPIGADVAPAEPPVIGAILLRTEVPRGVDRASASSSEDHHRRWRAGGLRTRINALLTRFAERFVDVSGERFEFFGAFTSRLIRLVRPGRCGFGRVEPPDVDHEADQDEGNQKDLVK
jgi:hypothetical protein